MEDLHARERSITSEIYQNLSRDILELFLTLGFVTENQELILGIEFLKIIPDEIEKLFLGRMRA